jgi:hypothetical protein
VKERLSAAAGALAFLVLFGGMGALGLWFTGSSIYDGLRARDWVLVKADIGHVDTGTATYAYEFQGRRYASDRVGTFALGGSTDLDDWEDRIDALLTAAVADKRPVTVFVNPERPEEAMLDREIRWRFVLVLMAIATASFAGGLFAFFAVGRKAIGWEPSGAGVPWLKPRAREALFQWGVGGVWNLLMLPVALIAIPSLWESGEWLGIVIVAVLAGFGPLILWSALNSTAACFKDGFFNDRSAA